LADATQKRAKSTYARIGGGTFSCNPMSMVAGLATVRVLRENRDRIYPRLNAFGARLRTETDAALREAGLRAETTGAGSLLSTHFPRPHQEGIRTAGDVAAADRRLQHAYYLGLMSRGGVFALPGHILAVSTAHTEADIEQVLATTRDLAPQLAQTVTAAPPSMVERVP
jgi:glutamate-1-semialdehyde 2,1-aminomutase